MEGRPLPPVIQIHPKASTNQKPNTTQNSAWSKKKNTTSLINKIRSLQNKPIPVPSPSSPRSLTPSSSAGAIGRLSTDPKKNKKERKDSKKVKGKITEDAGSQIQPEEVIFISSEFTYYLKES
jgi:hypothetical protein